jgi:PAS domain S-box-containing protein
MGHSDESKQPSEPAAPHVNDIFESVELASTVDFQEFKHFLDHVPIAIIVSRLFQGEQRIIYANSAFEVLTGRALGEIRGRDWSILNAFRNEDCSQVTLEQALLTEEDCVGTFRLEEPKPALVEVYAGVIKDEGGAENYRIAALVDVTARERDQREEFARQIRDKDLLLKEIQHRVKNNLQLITASFVLKRETNAMETGLTSTGWRGALNLCTFSIKPFRQHRRDRTSTSANISAR